MQCAWSAARKSDSVFQARFKRLAPRRGEKRTTMAVAHLMLLISKRQRVPSVPGLTLAVQ
jgi:hypothetical protein